MPNIVYGTVQNIQIDRASIDIQGDIQIPAGANPKSTNYFNYFTGDPAADRFMIEFYRSENEARNDENPIDVSEFLVYEIYPETPVAAEEGQTGHITITRTGRVPYETICIKLSICQEGSVITTSPPVNLNIDTDITRPRNKIFSNWQRR